MAGAVGAGAEADPLKPPPIPPRPPNTVLPVAAAGANNDAAGAAAGAAPNSEPEAATGAAATPNTLGTPAMAGAAGAGAGADPLKTPPIPPRPPKKVPPAAAAGANNDAAPVAPGTELKNFGPPEFWLQKKIDDEAETPANKPPVATATAVEEGTGTPARAGALPPIPLRFPNGLLVAVATTAPTNLADCNI